MTNKCYLRLLDVLYQQRKNIIDQLQKAKTYSDKKELKRQYDVLEQKIIMLHDSANIQFVVYKNYMEVYFTSLCQMLKLVSEKELSSKSALHQELLQRRMLLKTTTI